MAEERRRKDISIAIIVIVAGLLTGGVLTYVVLQPEEQPRYTPQYRVAESQRVPFGSADVAAAADDPAAPAAAEDAPAGAENGPAEAQETAPEAASDLEGERGNAPDSEELSPAERATIEGAQRLGEELGVTDYVELTEERYIRLSAKMVIDAKALSNAMGEDADPIEFQHILTERAAERLAEARVDPEDFWAYTRDVHSDPDRAKAMGERILREAEKHTQYKITVDDIPGVIPVPANGAGE